MRTGKNYSCKGMSSGLIKKTEMSPLSHSVAKLSRRYFLQSSAAALSALLLGCRADTSLSSPAAKLAGLQAFMKGKMAEGLFPGAVWLVAQVTMLLST